ncbi:MAG: acetyl-CoA carboxylase biotin carboxyl carrier protein [Kofleriaceae bacterium]
MAKKPESAVEHDPDGILAKVRALAEIINEHNLSELMVESQGSTVKLVRAGGAIHHVAAPVHHAIPAPVHHTPAPAAHAPAAPVAAAASAAAVDDKAHTVTSPFVGTFYRKPNPDAAEYVKLNGKVEKGAVLCIVEAMKLMNEIEADVSGEVVAILVEDGKPVEYGQALFKIRT